jgi:uncharacterized membrane protein (DUF485 family)
VRKESFVSVAPEREGPPPPSKPTIGTGHGGGRTWMEVQATDEFQLLRRKLRTFVFPAAGLFLAWYLLYILMSLYARGFMATKLLGEINVAYVFGLLQFVSTFVIAYIYSRYAGRNLDPIADEILEDMEAGR